MSEQEKNGMTESETIELDRENEEHAAPVWLITQQNKTLLAFPRPLLSLTNNSSLGDYDGLSLACLADNRSMGDHNQLRLSDPNG